MSCIAPSSDDGIANIDLTGTPFKVINSFSVGGWHKGLSKISLFPDQVRSRFRERGLADPTLRLPVLLGNYPIKMNRSPYRQNVLFFIFFLEE